MRVAKEKKKRFSISLGAAEYDALKRIADTHRPPLPLQFVARYAVQRFLESHRGQKIVLNDEQEE